MSHNRDLIDTIKTHFARRSSSQLEAIVHSNDLQRWSPEAIAAAAEVLQDRREGRVQEPSVPEEEPPPPRFDTSGSAFEGLAAFGLLTGLLTGFLVIPVRRVNYLTRWDPDLPVPFGPEMAWLALDTTNTEAVATSLGLQEVRDATWAEGIQAAHQASVFVTPPLADWTLVVGNPLFPPVQVEAFVKPLLEHLSQRFRDAQYFCTHQDSELHIWARARKGRLVRGYGWFGKRGSTLWKEGTPTRAERNLGFTFVDDHSHSAESTRQAMASRPDENRVMQLAFLWSIDPTTLGKQFKEPGKGLLGRVAVGASQTS